MDFFTILKAIILGIVEGVTEFAPVSSTGHMVIVDDMWLQSEQYLTKYVANTFKIVIQLGSILAVVIIFRNRFIELLGLRQGKQDEGQLGVRSQKQAKAYACSCRSDSCWCVRPLV